MTQAELSRLLGFGSAATWARIERGTMKLTEDREDRLARLMGSDPPPGSDGGGDGSPGDGDLPPLPLRPDLDDPEPPPTPRRRRSSSVLGEQETIELELKRLLAGYTYTYEDFEDGRPIRATAQVPGVANLLEAVGWLGDAALVRQLAPQLAHGYVAWGRTNRRVMAILRTITAGGGAREALIPTAQLLFGLAIAHGWVPSPAALIADMQAKARRNGGDPEGAVADPGQQAG